LIAKIKGGVVGADARGAIARNVIFFVPVWVLNACNPGLNPIEHESQKSEMPDCEMLTRGCALGYAEWLNDRAADKAAKDATGWREDSNVGPMAEQAPQLFSPDHTRKMGTQGGKQGMGEALKGRNKG
jgi:hypothetical protein